MNSAAVICLRWGVLECVKSKTYDVAAISSNIQVCVRENKTD